MKTLSLPARARGARYHRLKILIPVRDAVYGSKLHRSWTLKRNPKNQTVFKQHSSRFRSFRFDSFRFVSIASQTHLKVSLPRFLKLIRQRPRPITRHIRHHPTLLHHTRPQPSQHIRTRALRRPRAHEDHRFIQHHVCPHTDVVAVVAVTRARRPIDSNAYFDVLFFLLSDARVLLRVASSRRRSRATETGSRRVLTRAAAFAGAVGGATVTTLSFIPTRTPARLSVVPSAPGRADEEEDEGRGDEGAVADGDVDVDVDVAEWEEWKRVC